ncbi:MAG TPA: hypothetical protein VFO44_02060 [Steroidobacteraceae bacterium]|nr:hypothetical protein [Steroidobacteraceae bacterium]
MSSAPKTLEQYWNLGTHRVWNSRQPVGHLRVAYATVQTLA